MQTLHTTLMRETPSQVRNIPAATLDHPLSGKKMNHGVILKVIATNICGSDQHMVRGRTTAPAGLILGHEVCVRGGVGGDCMAGKVVV